MRYKFNEIASILTDGLTDVLIISETKLDSSFPDAQFTVPGFNMYRKDRTARGGGLIVYSRSDIQNHRIHKLESSLVENITVELAIGSNTWCLLAMYKPPKTKNSDFHNDCQKLLDMVLIKYDNILLIGDTNFDMLSPGNNGKTLTDISEIFDMKNVIKGATCFSQHSETLLDVALTNSPRSVKTHGNFDCGLSDCHNMIFVVFKSHVKSRKKQKIIYRRK